MINRKDSNKEYKLTKEHSIIYINHSYNNMDAINKIFNNLNFEQKDWDDKEFRRNFVSWYFINHTSNEVDWYKFIVEKLKNKINVNPDIKDEIKSVKTCIALKNKAKLNIIEQLLNMKDKNNKPICTSYEYNTTNKKVKINPNVIYF